MASVERRGDDLLKVNMLKRILENGIADNYVTLYICNQKLNIYSIRFYFCIINIFIIKIYSYYHTYLLIEENWL